MGGNVTHTPTGFKNYTQVANLMFLIHLVYVLVKHLVMRTINQVKRRICVVYIPHAHHAHHKNNTQLTVNNYIWGTHQQAIAGNVQALCIVDPGHISITTHLVQLQHKFSPAVEDNFDINSRVNRYGNWHSLLARNLSTAG